MTVSEKYIDIKKVFREKNPSLYRWIPGFVLNWIRRIVHENDINHTMDQIGDLSGLEFVRAGLDQLNARVEVRGLENIPPTGGVILAANHPLGGLDGVAFMEAVGRVRPDIRFLVNDILLNVRNFEPLFVPVNKHGANPRKATLIIEEVYASDQAVLVFPAGLVSRKIKRKIQDLPWKKSFINKAVRYNKPIVPVHIGGRNSNFFYNLSRLRTRLGIKANIEMFFLVDEMYRQRDKTITLTFGKPIPSTTFDKTRTMDEWAEYLRQLVHQLPR